MNQPRTKHERSRAWDDRVLPGWAWPIRALLRAFSSVRLGIALIACIGVYGAVGSVPLDLLPGTGLPPGTMVWMLPQLEMTQGEFFAAWPMKALLAALVANMVIATLRRIEFRFENLGVLTVHAGIVLIAVGSTIYASARREGVLVLPMSPDGSIRIASAWDAWGTELIIKDEAGERRIELPNLPRYNDYATAWDERGLLIRAGDDATIDGFAAYAESREIAVESGGGGDPAWSVRIRATGQVLIDTGPVVIGTVDDGHPALTVPGIAEVRSGPPGEAEPQDLPRVFIEPTRATVEVAGQRNLIDPIEPGGAIRLAPGVQLEFERFLPHARFQREPVPVARSERRRELAGTRRHALIRVHLAAAPDEAAWVPLSLDADQPTRIGGSLVWWRPRAMPLDPWRLSLLEFTPVIRPGDDADSARDFRATVEYSIESGTLASETIALNHPLTLLLGEVVLPRRLSIVHASWDREGWERGGTSGVLFAIFGVSLVRGTELIAAGAACMTLGTPWAFYIKPWLLRRRERLDREATA